MVQLMLLKGWGVWGGCLREPTLLVPPGLDSGVCGGLGVISVHGSMDDNFTPYLDVLVTPKLHFQP